MTHPETNVVAQLYGSGRGPIRTGVFILSFRPYFRSEYVVSGVSNLPRDPNSELSASLICHRKSFPL